MPAARGALGGAPDLTLAVAAMTVADRVTVRALLGRRLHPLGRGVPGVGTRCRALDGEEVTHPSRARERVVCAANVVNVDRRRRASHAARLQDDHRLGAAARAGHHDDATSCRPIHLTHEPSGQAALAARTGELREAVGIDERPVHD